MIVEIERFIATVDRGSFTKASQMLYLTQPALSLSIARLEKEISAKLFKRIGKRLVLTKDGESVYQIGIQIIKLWKKIKDPKRNFVGIPYSIGVFDNAALKLSKYFQKNLSKNIFKFEITIDRSRFLLRGLANGIFDICICVVGEDIKLEQNISLVKKFNEKLLPVSSKIWKKPFSKIPFILYNKNSATRSFIDDVFLKKSIRPTIIVESTNTSFMKELAIGGCGVALLPKNFIEREVENRKLFVQKLPFSFKREIGLYLSKDGRIKETDAIVKEIIKDLQ